LVFPAIGRGRSQRTCDWDKGSSFRANLLEEAEDAISLGKCEVLGK